MGGGALSFEGVTAVFVLFPQPVTAENSEHKVSNTNMVLIVIGVGSNSLFIENKNQVVEIRTKVFIVFMQIKL